LSLLGLADYHTHTGVTVDSNETEEACCQQAVALGLREIAFTNHIILDNPHYCMSPSSLEHHWNKIQTCQQLYPQVIIRLGIEVDYFENREKEIESIIQQYEKIIGRPFDFVMGAVHYLREIFFSSKNYAPALFEIANKSASLGDFDSMRMIYCEYFEKVRRAVESGLFNNIAHIDLIKKYAGELSTYLPFDDYLEPVEMLVLSLIKNNVGIEVNTKGLMFKISEFYPSEGFLKLYVSQALRHGKNPIITLGGDSHSAENVGAFFSEGVQAIKKAGCNQLTGFNLKQPFSIPI
jgi:histidinol-phosphatase (PHP family)